MTPEIQQLIFNLRNKPPVGEPITNEHLAQAADLIESLLADRDYYNVSNVFLNDLEELRKQRDEARRELCRIESAASGDPNMTRRAVAADLGWDCFKEDGK